MTGPYPPPAPDQQPHGSWPPSADPSWPQSQPPPQPQLWTQQPPAPKKSGNGLLIGLLVGGLVLLVLCVGGIGTAVYLVNRAPDTGSASTDAGVVDYLKGDPKALSQEHSEGPVDYPMTPPAGGVHHPTWQNCMGDVYTEPIGNEHAVHSLEHGAIWFTYRPGLPQDQLDDLVGRVRGQEYLMISPYPGQPTAISLQTWGYQLRLDKVDMDRIDAFVTKYRMKGPEPGAPCTNGRTEPA